MRGPGVLVVLAACGGAPESPAHLEEVGDIPDIFQEIPAAFDANDALVLMDGNTGLRRLAGDRLVTIPNGSQFSFGTIGIDRDGALLLGSSSTGQLARLEANDIITFIEPTPPQTFSRSAGVPSGAYHLVVPSAVTTLTLPAGGVAWEDSTRSLDRTLRAPDGTIYAIENGDVVRLEADDSATPLASCAEIAGGTCPDLELAGVDANNHVHLALPGEQSVYVLDPSAGSLAEITLPGSIEVADLVTGATNGLVIGSDPDRNDERSLWLLENGSTQLLRFATLGNPNVIGFTQLLADRAGRTYVLAQGKLQVVVID
ncbi:MAG: hypothetical protein H0V17_21985 [Deltaproteobacteria bacterium]|nr:hypothetical protein [Deltaproteobacteria bacterium]